MNAITPIPPLVQSIIPENAPFSPEQRAWLNGFFAAYLGLDGPVSSSANGSAAAEAEEDFPWHDAALAMSERLELAKDRKPERQLMAAMAQLDCGQCGYLCQTYAEAVWSGAEGDMGRCVPGGKETQRKLKEMMVALEPRRDGNPLAAPAVKTVGVLGTRDRPALATLVDAYPLTRPGSEKDVRHVVFDLSTTDLTYEAGDSLGVYARKNPQLVQAVLDSGCARDALSYRALRTLNPSPYMFYFDFGDFQVVGASPEILVRLEGENQTRKVTLCGPSTLVPKTFEQMGCRVTHNVDDAIRDFIAGVIARTYQRVGLAVLMRELDVVRGGGARARGGDALDHIRIFPDLVDLGDDVRVQWNDDRRGIGWRKHEVSVHVDAFEATLNQQKSPQPDLGVGFW